MRCMHKSSRRSKQNKTRAPRTTKRKRSNTQAGGKRKKKRNIYAKKQENFRKNPNLLARYVQEGTPWLQEKNSSSPKPEDVNSFHSSLWGASPNYIFRQRSQERSPGYMQDISSHHCTGYQRTLENHKTKHRPRFGRHTKEAHRRTGHARNVKGLIQYHSDKQDPSKGLEYQQNVCLATLANMVAASNHGTVNDPNNINYKVVSSNSDHKYYSLTHKDVQALHKS